ILRRLCARLDTAGGRDFARIHLQLLAQFPMREWIEDLDLYESPPTLIIPAHLAIIRRFAPQLPTHIASERAFAGQALIVFQLAERARIIDDEHGKGLLPQDQFVANLVDMVTAL